MNDNLSQLVKDTTPEDNMVFSESNLDLPAEDENTEEEVQEVEAAQESNVVPISDLASWFEVNSPSLDNINQVKVSIRGIDSVNTIIMAVKDGDEKDEQGNSKRVLRVFENANLTPVLNLPPAKMDIYNNGFRSIHQYSDTTFIKSYGVRTGLICTLCTMVNGRLIPYKIQRIKRKDTELEMTENENAASLEQKMTEDANLESLQLLYKQSARAVDDLSTNQTVIEWLTDRQESVTDINHHLQIDNVIIELMK